MDAIDGRPGTGTLVHPRDQRLSARKLWIAFAMRAEGRIIVDDGARVALVERGKSLLAAGVVGVHGDFEIDSGVEVVDSAGAVFAKGVSRYSSVGLKESAGLRSPALSNDLPAEVIHRDDLVILT